MNTNPDETKLGLWLEDELTGEELAAFEKWVADNPEWLMAREDARNWRAMMAAAIPREEEPPYPDFFNHRLQKSIHDLQPAPPPVARPRFSLRGWLTPLAACAGIVLAFWLGGKRVTGPMTDVTGASPGIMVEPALYTPEDGVAAEWISSPATSATVIVLSGVDAIPDSTDFSHTVYLNRERKIDSTATVTTDDAPIK